MGTHYIKVDFPLTDKFKLEARIQLDKDHTERWNLQNANHLKLVAQIDLELELKKKAFIGANSLDQKKLKLVNLASKCDMDKEIRFNGINHPIVLSFKLREPIRAKEFIEVPIRRLIIDGFPKPFRQPLDAQPAKV